jgi:carbon monoxide dehydrogenase subunit G
MDIAGSYTFDAPPEQVWALLMDPSVIASCIPGCDAFEPAGENTYRAKMTVALAAITGSYDGVVTLTDIVPHESYRLTSEGKGRPGFVKGNAHITLRADGPATTVGVAGTVQTGGPIARLGQRLIGGVSKMMMDRFFGSMIDISRNQDRAIAADSARRANT